MDSSALADDDALMALATLAEGGSAADMSDVKESRAQRRSREKPRAGRKQSIGSATSSSVVHASDLDWMEKAASFSDDASIDRSREGSQESFESWVSKAESIKALDVKP